MSSISSATLALTVHVLLVGNDNRALLQEVRGVWCAPSVEVGADEQPYAAAIRCAQRAFGVDITHADRDEWPPLLVYEPKGTLSAPRLHLFFRVINWAGNIKSSAPTEDMQWFVPHHPPQRNLDPQVRDALGLAARGESYLEPGLDYAVGSEEAAVG